MHATAPHCVRHFWICHFSRWSRCHTIDATLINKKLGTTLVLVERWGNFIANDILCFMDADVPADPEEDSVESFVDPRRDNAGRGVVLSSLRQLVGSGDLPFVVLRHCEPPHAGQAALQLG